MILSTQQNDEAESSLSSLLISAPPLGSRATMEHLASR